MSITKTLCAFIPVYNEEEFLQETLESVMAQTVKFDEYILIDDGSTDKTSLIYKKPAFSCFQIIKNNKNQGLLPTLNAHMSAVQSSHVIFLSGNDLLERDFVETFHSCCDELKEVGIFSSKASIVGRPRRLLRKENFLHTGYARGDMVQWLLCLGTLQIQPIIVFDAVLTKQIGFDERFLGISDLILGCRIANVKGFYFSSKSLGIARFHAKQFGDTSRLDVLKLVFTTDSRQIFGDVPTTKVVLLVAKIQIMLELLSCISVTKYSPLRLLTRLALVVRLVFLTIRLVIWGWAKRGETQ